MVVHLGRIQQRGPERGDIVQVAWCTGEPVVSPDTLTRLANFVTCESCPELFRQHLREQMAMVEQPDWTPMEERVAEFLTGRGYPPDAPPAASEYGLGLPGTVPQDITAHVTLSEPTTQIVQDRNWMTGVGPGYSGVGCDGYGIYLHPAQWNVSRLPGKEEALLAYFFKLIYLERLRQLKRWGDQRHPDGVELNDSNMLGAAYAKQIVERAAKVGELTWMQILTEEVEETRATKPVLGPQDAIRRDDEPDLESEMIQSAAVIAAWHSDVCRRVWEADESLDENMKGM